MALKDAPQCTAKSKRSGERCQLPAVTGFSVCRVHGAGSKKKPGGRPVSIGVHSRKLPEHLRDRAQELENSPELLSLQRDIVLVEVLLEDAAKRVRSGDSRVAWDNLLQMVLVINDARRRKDNDTVSVTLTELFHTIEHKKPSEFAAMDDLLTLIEHRRRLVMGEHKIVNDAKNVIRADQAHALVMALTHIVMENVTDAATRANIAKAMSKLLGAPVIEGKLVTAE